MIEILKCGCRQQKQLGRKRLAYFWELIIHLMLLRGTCKLQEH